MVCAKKNRKLYLCLEALFVKNNKTMNIGIDKIEASPLPPTALDMEALAVARGVEPVSTLELASLQWQSAPVTQDVVTLAANAVINH